MPQARPWCVVCTGTSHRRTLEETVWCMVPTARAACVARCMRGTGRLVACCSRLVTVATPLLAVDDALDACRGVEVLVLSRCRSRGRGFFSYYGAPRLSDRRHLDTSTPRHRARAAREVRAMRANARPKRLAVGRSTAAGRSAAVLHRARAAASARRADHPSARLARGVRAQRAEVAAQQVLCTARHPRQSCPRWARRQLAPPTHRTKPPHCGGAARFRRAATSRASPSRNRRFDRFAVKRRFPRRRRSAQRLVPRGTSRGRRFRTKCWRRELFTRSFRTTFIQ